MHFEIVLRRNWKGLRKARKATEKNFTGGLYVGWTTYNVPCIVDLTEY